MNEDLKNVRIKRDALHYMLGTAFIEIRAANSVHAAKKFADIFHNLPMGLLKCVASEDYEAEFLKLLERAKRYELDSYIRDHRVMAEKLSANRKKELNGTEEMNLIPTAQDPRSRALSLMACRLSVGLRE